MIAAAQYRTSAGLTALSVSLPAEAVLEIYGECLDHMFRPSPSLVTSCNFTWIVFKDSCGQWHRGRVANLNAINSNPQMNYELTGVFCWENLHHLLPV